MMRSPKTSKTKLRPFLVAASISATAALLLLGNMGLDADTPSTRLAILSGIRYDQADRTVRIVLDLNDHRPFTLGRLNGAAGLYLDIENTRLSSELRAGGPRLPSDSLIQVRARQIRRDTARVVFHVDSIARLQAVQLEEPCRIVVEMDLPSQSTPIADYSALLGFGSVGISIIHSGRPGRH
ncbi:MAG: AMIN domain-containing protein [Acidobacteria bacterium]|nr:AMIN domain-containing protein [Acidobacteriota bacterium]